MKSKKPKFTDLKLDDDLLREAAEIEEEIKDIPLEENPADKERLRAEILMRVLQEEQKEKQKKTVRRKTLQWAAVMVVTLVGIFGMSMTSQANRIFLVQKVEEFFNGKTTVNIDNEEGTVISDTSEQHAREDIEQTLELDVPELYYIPEGMEFSGYEIHENVGVADMYFEYNNKILTFSISGNDNNVAFDKSFDGNIIESFKSETDGFEIEIWEKRNDINEDVDACAQWIYKNAYYSFSGVIAGEEMKKILESIIY